MPIARARSDIRRVPLSSARLFGTTIAAPTPWTTRATVSVATDGATAHRTDPPSRTSSPITSIRRRPKRSARAPNGSSSAAAVSRYPVRTHWTPATPAPRSRPMAGIATFTTLASRKVTIDASTVATISPAPVRLRSAASTSGPLVLEASPGIATVVMVPSLRSAEDDHVVVALPLGGFHGPDDRRIGPRLAPVALPGASLVFGVGPRTRGPDQRRPRRPGGLTGPRERSGAHYVAIPVTVPGATRRPTSDSGCVGSASARARGG